MAVPMPQPQGRPLLDLLMHGIGKGTVKIPQFQRDFVWSRIKSAKLVDSLLRGFPIGTFILWETREQLRIVRNVGNIVLPETPDGHVTQYILDGQQRLTSIFAAVNGSTVTREGKDEDFSAIYVDLAVDEDDDDLVITNVDGRKKQSYISIERLVSPDLMQSGKFLNKYRKKMQAYRDAITSYVCSTVVVQEASIDVATEIFTRINVTGVPLTVFQIMVAKTFDSSRDFDLAEKVDCLLGRLSKVGYRTVREIVVLQTMSAIMVKDTRKKSMLALDKELFIDTWPEAEDGIIRAVEYLRSSFGIPVSELLPYQSMLVPLAYFFVKQQRTPSGDTHRRLKDLFWRTSLAGRYSQALDTKLGQDIRRVDEILRGRPPAYDYAVNPTPEFVGENGEFRTGRAFIKAILCLLASKRPRRFDNHDTYINVSNDWLKRSNSRNYHHFFPKKVLAGREELFFINHIVNITIVDDHLNKAQIGTREPSDYMAEFKEENESIEDTMETHLISLDRDGGVWDDNYDNFFRYRCNRISDELNKIIIPQDTDKHAQTPNSDDVESTDIPD